MSRARRSCTFGTSFVRLTRWIDACAFDLPSVAARSSIVATAGDQPLVARRFVERLHVFAMQVLDDRGFVRHRLIELQHARRDGGDARELRRTETPGARNQHEAVAVGPHQNRLQHAVAADARGEFLQARLGKRASWIGGRVVHGVDLQLSELTHDTPRT